MPVYTQHVVIEPGEGFQELPTKDCDVQARTGQRIFIGFADAEADLIAQQEDDGTAGLVRINDDDIMYLGRYPGKPFVRRHPKVRLKLTVLWLSPPPAS